MGAWGLGNFDNDSALDWLAELDDPGVVGETLRSVAEASDDAYLDVDSCCAALAAAEIVAACRDQRGENAPRKAEEWAHTHSDIATAELVLLARKATQRVESGSELQELFDEGRPNEEWHSVIESLLKRLGQQPRSA